MVSAFVGLGSNLGKRQAALRTAARRLGEIANTRVVKLATFRETEAVDSPPGAPRFINSAAELETTLPPEALLQALLHIERDLGRIRDAAPQNAPRLIDLDLLMYGNSTIKTASLTLPHPRMHLRRFVLEPLAEIAPAAIHPPTGKSVRDLLAALNASDRAPREPSP